MLVTDEFLEPCYYSLDFYSDTVPTNGTPSYRGHAVKYSYKITVGTSRVQGDSKMLRLPIRILVIQGNYLFKRSLEIISSEERKMAASQYKMIIPYMFIIIWCCHSKETFEIWPSLH